MERTSYSKLSQRDVDRAETDLLINLSAITQRGLAKMIGCHESKISRTDWRFIASVLCAFGMASDISPISRAFKYALDGLTNKKRPAATERSEQIQMEFARSLLDQSTGVIMTNTAKILNFCRGNFAKQERNVADLDDGYARLSNMLLEAYSGADLTKRQFKVLLAILRKTYGSINQWTESPILNLARLQSYPSNGAMKPS